MSAVHWMLSQLAGIVLGTIFLGAFGPASLVLRCLPARRR